MAFNTGIVSNHAIVQYNRNPNNNHGAATIFTATGQVDVDGFLGKVNAAAAALVVPTNLYVLTGFHGNNQGDFLEFFDQAELNAVLNAANDFPNARLMVYSHLQQADFNNVINPAHLAGWHTVNQLAKDAAIPAAWRTSVTELVQIMTDGGLFYTWCDSQSAITDNNHIDGYELHGSYVAD
ncbi:hypothetical protein POG22_00290 [Geitlerinema sp. CS-897]|nr:hypothetical protein [Geitlerinema sp. CS-897]